MKHGEVSDGLRLGLCGHLSTARRAYPGWSGTWKLALSLFGCNYQVLSGPRIFLCTVLVFPTCSVGREDVTCVACCLVQVSSSQGVLGPSPQGGRSDSSPVAGGC